VLKSNQKGSDYMMQQQKEYSPEQISDAEKLCLFLQGIKDDSRRNYVSSMAMAYISGIEYGIAAERDAQKVKAV